MCLDVTSFLVNICVLLEMLCLEMLRYFVVNISVLLAKLCLERLLNFVINIYVLLSILLPQIADGLFQGANEV